MSTEENMAPAIGAPWFTLTRHDDPDPANTSSEDDEAARLLAEAADGDAPDLEGDEPDPEEDDDADAAALGDKGKQALARMKEQLKAAKAELNDLKEGKGGTGSQSKLAREAAAAKKTAAEERRKSAELARKVAEFEDREKSELEKVQSQAERAKDQAAKAVARSVRSEIKVAAGGTFADVSDATDVLMRDPSKYIDADGDIDTDAIEADLADLLERKPHWAKPEPAPASDPEPAKKPQPRPDPGQGSRGTPAKVDFRTASDDEVAAEMAKYGVRKRY